MYGEIFMNVKVKILTALVLSSIFFDERLGGGAVRILYDAG